MCRTLPRSATLPIMNFTAEQQVQLENSRAANTMNLNNLSNNQAMVMAEAAALAQMDTANLNNRQQAAVKNAQSFLNMDMANLSNTQQTSDIQSTTAYSKSVYRSGCRECCTSVQCYFAKPSGSVLCQPAHADYRSLMQHR